MRILFLTQRLPYAPNRGDRIRAWHELRALSSRHEVHVAALVHDAEEAAHVGDLSGIAASVHPIRVTRVRNYLRAAAGLRGPRPLTHALLDGAHARRVLRAIVSREPPDLVLAYCSSMARFALEPPLHPIPFLLDLVDVDSEKWRALSAVSPVPKRWLYRREARTLRTFERQAVAAAKRTFVVNEREAVLLREIAGGTGTVEVLESGVDVDYWRPPSNPAESLDVVFCGVMDYPPNEQGAIWLVSAVWPLVLARCPQAHLWLVGSRPTRRLANLGASAPSVTVTGTVPDVRPFLWRAAVAAAPLGVARGIQNKVLEAVAGGLPAVVTPAVAAGLPPEIRPACIVADPPAAFSEAILSLLATTPGRRRAIARTASLERLDWASRLAPLLLAVEEEPGGVATRTS